MAPPRQVMAGVPQAGASQKLRVQSTELTRVALRNFKGHEDLRLDMGKITVLIGPTRSGKSTVLQALNLLRSALRAGSFGMLEGGSPEYGHFADVVTRRDDSRDVGIAVEGAQKIRTRGGGDVAADFAYDVSFGSSLRPSSVRATVDMMRDPPPSTDEGMRVVHVYGAGEKTTTVSCTGDTGGSPASVPADGGLAPHIDIEPAECPAARAFRDMFSDGEFFESLLGELWHVPFSRVVTSYALPLEYAEDFLSPDRARGAASLVSHISGDHSIREKISDMMQEIGLGKIATRSVPAPKGEDAALALDFVGDDTFSSIVHEGSGPNQLVSMLAVLAHSPRGAVVTIEEPEIHLDPAAQARLMGILVRQATEEGKQIVFTTHSDHLLYPLLAYVAKAGCPLASGDVAMHYFDTDGSGRVAGAERLAINEHGQIRGGLRGFWYADGRAMGEILDRGGDGRR